MRVVIEALHPTDLLIDDELAQANLKLAESFIPRSMYAYDAIATLAKQGLFNGNQGQSNFKKLMSKDSNYDCLFERMRYLGLLAKENAQSNFDAVMYCPAIDILKLNLECELLKTMISQDLFSILVTYTEPTSHFFLTCLEGYSPIDKTLLSKYAVEILKHPEIFFGNEDAKRFWIDCSYKDMTTEHFDKIIGIATQYGNAADEGLKKFIVFAKTCPLRSPVGNGFFDGNLVTPSAPSDTEPSQNNSSEGPNVK